MHGTLKYLLAILIAFLAAGPAWAGSWTSTQNPASIQDAELRRNFVGQLGSLTTVEIRHEQGGLNESPRRGVFRSITDWTAFIPAGSTITRASLWTKISHQWEMGSLEVGLSVVGEFWQEFQCDWTVRITGVPWTNEGAWGAAGDGGGEIDIFNGPYVIGNWIEWDISSYCQGVIDGSWSRDGVVMKRVDEVSGGSSNFIVHSSQRSTVTDRPYMEIEWTEPSGGTQMSKFGEVGTITFGGGE